MKPQPSYWQRFQRAHLAVIRIVGRLPHGHGARALLFRMGGSPRGIQTLADLLEILAMVRRPVPNRDTF